MRGQQFVVYQGKTYRATRYSTHCFEVFSRIRVQGFEPYVTSWGQAVPNMWHQRMLLEELDDHFFIRNIEVQLGNHLYDLEGGVFRNRDLAHQSVQLFSSDSDSVNDGFQFHERGVYYTEVPFDAIRELHVHYVNLQLQESIEVIPSEKIAAFAKKLAETD